MRDARIKFRRTPLQSYYLSWWLTHQCASCRVSMLGYSYGARTILGALHLVGGGTLEGRCLPASCRRCAPRIRIAVWAAASQADWLLPGRPHGCALNCLECGAIFYNCKDPVLRGYRCAICSASGPALGLRGLIRPHCGPPCYARIVQYNATRWIGCHHNWDHYRDCWWTFSRICNMALGWERCSCQQVREMELQIALAVPLITILQ